MSASKTNIEVPESVRSLAGRIAAEGGRAYLVGGGVRDAILGRPSKDVDIEVFGVPAARLQGILESLGHVNTVGKSFGVLKWRPFGHRPGDDLDVSIPRRDNKEGPGHRGIAVEGDPTMSVAEAARRRDLTVNAILYDVLDQRLVDPAGGLDDLREGRLRAVDRETFLEDPLRALRVVQFAARLQMEPTDELVALCREAPLHELPAERIQGEWHKLLIRSTAPSIGFRVARRAHILRRVFPEVADVDRDAVLDALVPARDAMRAADDGPAWVLMLGAWLGRRPAEQVVAVLDRLWLHKVGHTPVRDKVLAVTGHLDAPIATLADLRRLSTRAEPRLVLAIREAEGIDVRSARGACDAEGILEAPPPPMLQGRDLMRRGHRPGPWMGEVLRAVYERQLDGAVTSPEQALALAEQLAPG